MDLVSHCVLAVAAACFTLCLINLRLWLGNRSYLDQLAVAGVCFFGGAYSLFEVVWLHSTSPLEFAEIARWSQIASWAVIVSLAIFLRMHLRAGRTWLLWALIATRTFGLLVNFAMPLNIQYKEITSIEQITVLGENVSRPIGVMNPWNSVQLFSLVLLIAFAIDVCVSVWRRGEGRKALIFAGGAALLGISSLFAAVAILWGAFRFPFFASPSLLFVIIGMAVEFDYDLRRSARLAHELTDREIELTEALNQLNLSTSAAQIGLWVRHANGWLLASRKMRELFEFDPEGPLTIDEYMEKVHPGDRERLLNAQKTTFETGEPYEVEYRIRQANGSIRWMRSTGQVGSSDHGEKSLRGASVDITRRKLAEDDAHEFSSKLINAQEKERARLARELHDDLSQSLAILSIQLQSLAGSGAEREALTKKIPALTGQIQRLSSDVHRISHELHPSKLSQLGLEAAVRGFCRETGAAHGLKVGFRAANVPRRLPDDLSLCIYRIAQEALQNVAKHSGASKADVELRLSSGVVTLIVSDNGCGFDPEKAKAKEALGLISMNERIRAVDGTLTVESAPGSGTKIEARVPLPPLF